MVRKLAEATGSISFSMRGEKGESGDTPYVTKTVVDYAITSSVSEAKKWSSAAPDASAAANKGKFLWTRTTYTWSNNKTTENITYTYIGKDGKDGTSVTIKGSKGSTSELPTSGNTLGDGYIIGGYLWVYTGTSKTDSTHAKGFENVGKIQGDPGTPAVQYYTHIAWMKDSKGTGFTTTAGGGEYAYVGVLVDKTPTDSEDWTKYDWSYVKGKKGDTGKGIKSTEVTYQIGSSGTEHPNGVWSPDIQNITDEKPFLWTRTIFKYTDGTDSKPSFSVATRGTKGALMREHEGFESGKYKYLSGSGAEAYLDVVYINKRWWQCIVTYKDPTSSPKLDDGHWKVMEGNYTSIATHLLLAENATINMLGTNQINLFNPTTGGKMYGSFRVVDDIDKWSLWLGGETGDSASFAVTRGGAIKATAGRIGSFTITERKDPTGFVFYSLYATHNSFGIIPACDVELDHRGIHVWSGNNTATNYTQVDLGYNGGLDANNPTWYNGVVNITGNATNGGGADVVAIYTNIYPKTGWRSYVLWSEQGDIFLNNGAFIGALRPNVTTKSDSATLSENECYIVCTNSSSITLTLPSNPRKGQLYFVYQANAYVSFSSTSAHPIIAKEQGYPSGKTTWYSNTKGQLSIFMYGSDNRWYVAYMNG